MKTLMIVLTMLLALVVAAHAAPRTLAWVNAADTTGLDGTSIQRALVSGNKCGPFVEITTVPVETVGFVDGAVGLVGFQCYQVQYFTLIDFDDGLGPQKMYGGTSNRDANKPGNQPSNLKVIK